MARKGRSVEEKLALVLEGLKGGSTVADICRRNGVNQSQYYKWRDKFISHGKKALDGYRKNGDARLKAKINELERALGRATMKVEILKKTRNDGKIIETVDEFHEKEYPVTTICDALGFSRSSYCRQVSNGKKKRKKSKKKNEEKN